MTMTFGSIHVLAALPGGRDLFQLFAVPRQRQVRTGSRLDRIFRLAMEAYDEPEWTIMAMITPWSELVMKELLRHDAGEGRLRISGADPLVEAVLVFLESNLSRSLSLAELARHAWP